MYLLVVDDEPVIRRGLVKMAEQYTPPFTKIQSAENGVAALERIRAAEPDIVLTDIRMPKMDGLELCRVLHEQFPQIMTVVISGYSDFEYAQKCMGYGVKHYLLKPVARPGVHEVLDQIVKKVRGYVPPSRYIEWIDRMEQHIWALQIDDLDSLCAGFREYCHSLNLSLVQLKDLLSDCAAMLHKRLQARGFTPQLSDACKQADHAHAALEAFELGLRQMAEALSAMRSGNFRDPMKEVKAYIDNKLAEEISLEQVAAMIGLAPTYFSALFKKMTSETFVQYRINKRMEKAKELLSVPHIRIVDVAVKVGYDDYSHFTKTFKKVVGVSPSEYRMGLGIK